MEKGASHGGENPNIHKQSEPEQALEEQVQQNQVLSGEFNLPHTSRLGYSHCPYPLITPEDFDLEEIGRRIEAFNRRQQELQSEQSTKKYDEQPPC